MGIKGLWSVLTPYCEKKSLHEMRGETVAVDLAGWVCDSQHAVDQRAAHKLYLRNLFFRTSWLLLCDVQPVFVLEGNAPGLKSDELARRAALRRGGGSGNGAPDLARRRFNTILSECSALLRCMGVSCVRAVGEGEATCAALNAHKLVDAVISQDSDSFAYGARRVYRNFTVTGGGGGGGSSVQGSVQCYDIQQINKFIDFGRNKMVALASLCGSDYGAGAVGSSLAAALAFLQTVHDFDVLQRLESWCSDGARYDELEERVRGSRAGVCQHCPVLSGPCNHPQHKAGAAATRRELALRARALAFSASAGEPFPPPRLRTEFLREAPPPSAPSPPRPPDLLAFVKLMRDKLGWTERYSVEKLLPLVTRAHLAATTHHTSDTLRPKCILAKRKPRGVPCLEVLWSSVDAAFDGLIPDDQLKDGESAEDVWRTCEPRDSLQRRYPDLVAEFDSRTVRRRRCRGAAAASAQHSALPASLLGQPKTLSTSLKNMSLCEPAEDVNEKSDSDNGNVLMDEDSSCEEDEFTEGDLSHLVEDIVSDSARPLVRPAILGRDAVTLLFGDRTT